MYVIMWPYSLLDIVKKPLAHVDVGKKSNHIKFCVLFFLSFLLVFNDLHSFNNHDMPTENA
jgi:cbb3-type cytochrome oxidase subunit 1